VNPTHGSLTQPASGKDAVGAFFWDWFRTFGTEVSFEITRIRGGGDAVAVEVRHRAKGRSSGIEVTDDLFYEYRLKRGKIERIRFHETWAEALEAAGLSE
jgi:ketosteroid isomerase-like protein